MEEFEMVVEKILLIFGQRDITSHELKEVIEDLHTKAKDVENLPELILSDSSYVDDNDAFKNSVEGKAQREKSPFYQHFKARREAIKLEDETLNKKMDTGKFKNEHYSPVVLDTIQNTYIAYFPLFAAAVPATKLPDFTRRSNAVVESYYRKLKILLHSIRNVFGPEFLKKHAEIVIGILNEVGLKILTKSNRVDVIVRKPNIEVEGAVHSEESWQRKTKPRSTYFSNDIPKFVSDIYALAKPSRQPGPSNTHKQPYFSTPETDIQWEKKKLFHFPGADGFVDSLETLLHGWVDDLAVNCFASIIHRNHNNTNKLILDSLMFRRRTEKDFEENPALPLYFAIKSSARTWDSKMLQSMEEIFIPFSGAGHWILIHFNRHINSLKIYDSIPKYFPKQEMETLIEVIWKALQPGFGKRLPIEYPKVQKQTGGTSCGVHVMIRMEDCFSEEANDYSEDSVERKRLEVLKLLLNTWEGGKSFLQTFGGSDRRLKASVLKYAKLLQIEKDKEARESKKRRDEENRKKVASENRRRR